MAGWTKMVSLELDDEDKLDWPTPIAMDRPDYPPGTRICFSEKELKKLGLEVPEIGDMIDLRAFGEVTSVSIDKTDGEDRCRVEIQLQRASVEDGNKE